VPEAPKDPILGISEKYNADPKPHKINLGVGAYRDDDGKPVVLNCVREAESRVAGTHFMEYLPIGGLKDFVSESVKLAYGDDVPLKNVAAVQSLSGTGSCRLFADFQRRFMPHSAIYIPSPTWSNHHNIWADAGVPQKTYRYYKASTKGLDFEGLMEDVKAAPSGSSFLLHACAHNPTGVDPTPEQWQELSQLMAEKGHFPVFDMAYQGFASGDCTRDAQAIRTFLADGHRMALSQSFAKNMGLYGQRVGCFSIVCDDPKEASAVESQMKNIARPMYSNPPLFGALLVAKILHDADLKKQWFEEVKVMADRIISTRSMLRERLEALNNPHNWEHITSQIGMFCFSGMTPEQVDKLAKDYSIYMTRNGRISMAGVNTKNVDRLAEAINDVTK
jgi:aspartate aminotransferase